MGTASVRLRKRSDLRRGTGDGRRSVRGIWTPLVLLTVGVLLDGQCWAGQPLPTNVPTSPSSSGYNTYGIVQPTAEYTVRWWRGVTASAHAAPRARPRCLTSRPLPAGHNSHGTWDIDRSLDHGSGAKYAHGEKPSPSPRAPVACASVACAPTRMSTLHAYSPPLPNHSHDHEGYHTQLRHPLSRFRSARA